MHHRDLLEIERPASGQTHHANIFNTTASEKSSGFIVASVARCTSAAIKQLPPRVLGLRYNRAVYLRRRIVERERRDCAQQDVEPYSTCRRVSCDSMHAAFRLDACHDGHQNGIVEWGHTTCDGGVTVAQMDRDIGVERLRHQQSPRSSGDTSSRGSIASGAGSDASFASMLGMLTATEPSVATPR